MRMMVHRAIPSVLLLAGAIALVGCVDEDVVFDDRPIYQRIADGALGYLGYADPSSEDKLTFCGQCHGALQASWEGTAHAGAWEGLQSSDYAQAFCEACHSVNSLGNIHPDQTGAGSAIGGHIAVTDKGRYHDVQCESCHGPGLEHTLDPTQANVPAASILAGTGLAYGCGECHNGTHHPFVNEWASSPHGSVRQSAAQNPSCSSCHSGEGGLQRLGVRADYLEKDSLLASDDAYAQITCAVCHDPHDATNEGQLRVAVSGTTPEASLCGQCHNRQANPDTEGRQEWLIPHSAEAALLGATAGWIPPGSSITPGSSTGPHGAGNNQGLCASCHVVDYSVTNEDGETFFSAGHGFRAAPCVDANGLPSGATGCALTTTARSFEGCAECHGDAATALADLNAALDRIRPLATQLEGYVNQLGSEINDNDFRFSVAEGALFNLRLATTRATLGTRTVDGQRRALAGAVTHNPGYIEALLQATITAVQTQYPALSTAGARSGSTR